MSTHLNAPSCRNCHSIELQIFSNDEVGPMIVCEECGYSFAASYEHFVLSLIETKAS